MVSIDKNKVYIFDDILEPNTQDLLVDKIGVIEWTLAINKRPHTHKIKIKDSDIWNQNRPGLIQSFQFDDDMWMPTSKRWFVEPPLSALQKKSLFNAALISGSSYPNMLETILQKTLLKLEMLRLGKEGYSKFLHKIIFGDF